MGRSKLEDKNVRKIFKSGGKSYSVTLPIDLVRKLKWKEKQKVTVKLGRGNKKLIIEDWDG